MSFLKTVFVTLLLLCANNAFAADAIPQQNTVDPQKAAVIHQLLEISGAINIGEQIMTRMLDAQKKAHPEVDAVVWDRLAAKLDLSTMQNSIVAIYDRHFSLEDLQAVLAFYKSATGQRMIKELPDVMNEAMTTGQKWGQEKSEELRQELIEEQSRNTAIEKNA